FFFQAEDGIRDDLVTGVQTCALPISGRSSPSPFMSPTTPTTVSSGSPLYSSFTRWPIGSRPRKNLAAKLSFTNAAFGAPATSPEIGRASCREREGVGVVAGAAESTAR